MVNFPLYVAAPAHGVYITQLMRYARVWGSYNDSLVKRLPSNK